MKKIITGLFMMLLSISSAHCMKRAHSGQKMVQQKLKCPRNTPATEEPFLPVEMIKKICLDLFKEENVTQPPRVILEQIQKICLINKEMYRYITLVDTVRIIFNNASRYLPPHRGVLAHEITIPSVTNYLHQSETLHKGIHTLSEKEIKNLVLDGADVNYCRVSAKTADSAPLLFETQKDYAKTKLLLELGADPRLSFDRLEVQRNGQALYECMSPFMQAIRQHNLDILKLFFEYYPDYHDDRFLRAAIATHNLEIIKFILETTKIHPDRLNTELKDTICRENIEETHLLLKIGANPSLYLVDVITQILLPPATNTLVWQQGRQIELDHPLLTIFDLLCHYGGWDQDAYNRACCLENIASQLLHSINKNKPQDQIADDM